MYEETSCTHGTQRRPFCFVHLFWSALFGVISLSLSLSLSLSFLIISFLLLLLLLRSSFCFDFHSEGLSFVTIAQTTNASDQGFIVTDVPLDSWAKRKCLSYSSSCWASGTAAKKKEERRRGGGGYV